MSLFGFNNIRVLVKRYACNGFFTAWWAIRILAIFFILEMQYSPSSSATFGNYTMQHIVIFPVHKNSMNQRRGTNLRIADRWDLTLECIRRHYAGEESPLSKVIESDNAFYDLFVDFKGYVDFFFMQDCVSADYSSVDIWMGDAPFEKNGLPETVEDYFSFLAKEHIFLDKRNSRIQEYCIEHGLI